MSNGRSIGRDAARESVPDTVLYDAALLNRLWLYLRPYADFAGASLALLMINSALGVFFPLLTQVAVDRYLRPDPSAHSFLDRFLPSDPLEGILTVAGMYLAVLAASALTRSIQIHTMNYTGQHVMRDIRREVFSHIQRLPVPYFDRTPSGRLVTRATTDVDVLNELFTSGLVAVAGDVLTLVCAFGAMLYLSPQLTLVYLCIAPLVFGVSFVFRRYARNSFRDVRKAVAKLASFLQECFTGIAVLQLFNYERPALRKFESINEEHREANYRAVRAHAVFFPVIDWLNYLGLALLIVFGGRWVVEGAVSLGVLLAFLQYGTRIFRPIQDLAEKYNVLQSAMAGAERIFGLLDTEPDAAAETGKPRRLEEPSIEFRKVWFAYKDGDWVLRDVSFDVRPGEMLAVVGHTGAGKSTLVSLLLRFYEIQRGEILVGGRDIREWAPEELRKQFSVVLQDPTLFSGTIAENIGLADPSVSDRAIPAGGCQRPPGESHRIASRHLRRAGPGARRRALCRPEAVGRVCEGACTRAPLPGAGRGYFERRSGHGARHSRHGLKAAGRTDLNRDRPSPVDDSGGPTASWSCTAAAWPKGGHIRTCSRRAVSIRNCTGCSPCPRRSKCTDRAPRSHRSRGTRPFVKAGPDPTEEPGPRTDLLQKMIFRASCVWRGRFT